jgi:hypothetical protein
MLPIIRRIRRPLLPPVPDEILPVPQRSTGTSLTESPSLPVPDPAPWQGGAGSPSTPQPDPAITANRSDFGQFRTDSTPTAPSDPKLCSPSVSLTPATISNQPSTLNTSPLWSLQPNEPAADYQLFAAWIQLPTPRHFPKAAGVLGCSLHRLRRLSARHNWKGRAAAFDNHRAKAFSLALDQLLHEETSGWKERAERFRLQEWLLHEQMLQAASHAAREIRKRPGRVSVNDIVKLYELALVLGRSACGVPFDLPATGRPGPSPPHPDFEAALHKIYGQNDSSQRGCTSGGN